MMTELDHGNHLLTLYTRNVLRYLAKKRIERYMVQWALQIILVFMQQPTPQTFTIIIWSVQQLGSERYVIGKVTQELIIGFLPKLATCNNANSLDISRQPKLKGHKSLVPFLSPYVAVGNTLAKIKVHNPN